MDPSSANSYGHISSSSELILSYSGDSQPPSYSQLPENSGIQPGKYVFRDIPTLTATETTTVIVSKDGRAPPIYHFVVKKVVSVSTYLVVIRRGPPEIEGKVLATFEIHGRDMIVVESKPHVLSRTITYVKANNMGPKNFYSSLGNPHHWIRDMSDTKIKDHRLLCLPDPWMPLRPPVHWARFYFADPMFAVWKPNKYLAEHELEVLPAGVNLIDDCLVSLVVLLLAREDVVEKLFVA
ncbi:hypothetical protein DL96DRAFT_1621715 [Flagelloscypha sp. PMI_526]|nr:hypothetical protein DL96DRAFT_1621715 [Flagelloscypha sp. PMI_526]